MGALLNRRKILLDLETANVVEAVAIIPEIKDKEFAKVYKLFSEKVLLSLASMGYEAKLLVWFLAQTVKLPQQSDMWILVDYEQVAKEIGVSTVSVKRYVKKLLELGFIEQFKKRQTVFRLRPELVYKGILVRYMESFSEFELRMRKKLAKNHKANKKLSKEV